MSSHDRSRVHGGCHCGGIKVFMWVTSALSKIHPRACDCSFCCKHGALWISDPAGKLHIEARESLLHSYRQGSSSARFLLCAGCGVLVSVIFEDGPTIIGAINARCLNDAPQLGATETVSPRLLERSDKVARWQQVWMPDVKVVLVGANSGPDRTSAIDG